MSTRYNTQRDRQTTYRWFGVSRQLLAQNSEQILRTRLKMFGLRSKVTVRQDLHTAAAAAAAAAVINGIVEGFSCCQSVITLCVHVSVCVCSFCK